MSEDEQTRMLSRRHFLESAIKMIGGLVAVVVGAPIIGYVFSPLLQARQEAWNEVSRVDDFRVGQTVYAIFPAVRRDGWVKSIQRIPIYVRRTDQRTFLVFSPKCTHLGCLVRWSENAHKFFSPCHAGVFDENGVNISGPPPRPLDRYDYKVEDGRLYVGALQISQPVKPDAG